VSGLPEPRLVLRAMGQALAAPLPLPRRTRLEWGRETTRRRAGPDQTRQARLPPRPPQRAPPPAPHPLDHRSYKFDSRGRIFEHSVDRLIPPESPVARWIESFISWQGTTEQPAGIPVPGGAGGAGRGGGWREQL
jgi:hypothetical protein